jgi:light-regulated signal transduction histidine kinase (bacteriophytochrome)
MNDAVDLTNCDREPIHIPGSIQPHGAMLVCEAGGGRITHVSANAAEILNLQGNVVGATLAEVLGEQAAHDLRNALAKSGGGQVPGLVMEMALPRLDYLVDASVHDYLGRTFVEVQPVVKGSGTARDAFDTTHSVVLRIGRETDVTAIANSGVKLIRAMLGYDRVMAYRLLHNGAGRVIAEARRSDLKSFMGQHFPASDIPHQARRLYLLNTIRGICDASYAPSPLTPFLEPGEAPIDMSFAQLRSVSPIHCEYLRNMGVAGSLSISIIVDGALWGLIACHHNSPKIVPMPMRVGAELFGQYFSLQIDLAERRAEMVAADRAHEELDEIVASLGPGAPVGAVMRDRLPQIAALLPCDGAGLWIDGAWHGTGATPAAHEIPDVMELINRTTTGRAWETDELRAQLGNGRVYGAEVAGVMAIPISSAPRDYLLLFRSEEAHRIEWAGEPVKAVMGGALGDRLTPRGSFDVWREEVRGRSLPWTRAERAIAELIRNYLRDVVLQFTEATADERGRAEQRRRVLNDELNHRVKNIIALVK